MHINYILIPFVIVFGLIFSSNDTKRNRLIYIILCSVVLIFIAAMRSPEWMEAKYGIDTLVYKQYFEQTLDMSWDELGNSLYARYFQNVGDYDIGFVALSKFVGFFTDDFYIFSIIVDLLFFIPFGIILYRYTYNYKQIMFAFVFYIALVQTYLIGGARQIFAVGIDMMALLAMLDRKKLLSLFFFVLGLTVHMSSFLFAIPLLMILYKIKPSWLKVLHFVFFLLFPVVLAFPNELITFMGNAIGMEKYANYGTETIHGGAVTYISMMVFLSFFCYVSIKKTDLTRNETIRNFYIMAPLFTIFAPLIRSNGSMDRITLYFYIYIVLLVPYGIECMFSKGNKNLAYFGAIGGLAFLSLMSGGLEYYFFWQR